MNVRQKSIQMHIYGGNWWRDDKVNKNSHEAILQKFSDRGLKGKK